MPGGAAHHIILLWPFPILIVAVALARMPLRIAAPVVALMCGANLAVTDHYYADLIRNGGTVPFSDAIYPLNQTLANLKAKRVFVMDWGIIETINLLSEGKTPVIAPEPGDREYKRRMFTDPGISSLRTPARMRSFPGFARTWKTWRRRTVTGKNFSIRSTIVTADHLRRLPVSQDRAQLTGPLGKCRDLLPTHSRPYSKAIH